MGLAKAGKFLLRGARQVSKIYLTAYLASRLIRHADKQWEDISKEGSNVKVFNAENVDFSYLNPIEVVFPPKSIRTEAVQVTLGNIGALSLEFEADVSYTNDKPTMRVLLERGNDQGELTSWSKILYIGDWIVSLWGQIYVYKNDVFMNTFHFMEEPPGSHSVERAPWDRDSTYSETLSRGVLDDPSFSGTVEGPGGTQIMPKVQE